MPPSPTEDDYDSSSSTDSNATPRAPSIDIPLITSDHPPATATYHFQQLLPSQQPPALPSSRSQFYPPHPHISSSSDSETDSTPTSLRSYRNHGHWWRERRPRWWSASQRRRRRDTSYARVFKRCLKRILRHPFIPRQPVTIVLTLIFLTVFAIFLTLLLMYILNPDKEPLPWRAYCSVPGASYSLDQLPQLSASPSHFLHPDNARTFLPSFPPSNLDTLSPAGVFVGVFSIDSAVERRMLVRTTWASHPRSRNGAGEGDGGQGTSRTVVRFILGQPRKDWERRIKLEMEMYNDIVILPIAENMNGGKTHSFFSWASLNAWVPPVYYTNLTTPTLSYSNQSAPPPPLASHDPLQASRDRSNERPQPWVRPDYVVKVDDDSFVMLAELETRLRVELHTAQGAMKEAAASRALMSHNITQDPLVYWGYLVTNRLHQFMAGELYALSWSLVDWAAKDPTVKTLTRGAEDKQTAKWMRLHPQASQIRWTSERCWIYDHPRGGTVYSHGFLFPSEATRVTHSLSPKPKDFLSGISQVSGGSTTPTPSQWALSSVSIFGVRYAPPVPELSLPYSVEALVEGSEMSGLGEGNPMTPEYAWHHRQGRTARYQGQRVGGTIVVHFIKKHMWFMETAIALLEGEELSESEKFHGEVDGRHQ
ncbi:hypothetical protein AX16_009590 [Volvariella volvacea WC 439]|nr:hypothetical protein AX16_009590 [Volvariella volvacea WC 439]